MQIGKTEGNVLLHEFNLDYIWTSTDYLSLSRAAWCMALEGSTVLYSKYNNTFCRYFNDLNRLCK